MQTAKTFPAAKGDTDRHAKDIALLERFFVSACCTVDHFARRTLGCRDLNRGSHAAIVVYVGCCAGLHSVYPFSIPNFLNSSEFRTISEILMNKLCSNTLSIYYSKAVLARKIDFVGGQPALWKCNYIRNVLSSHVWLYK